MHQNAKALGQDAMRLDRRHAPLGVYAIRCQRVASGDVQPVQFAGHTQARQRARPAGQSIGRRRLARILIGLVHLRRQRVKERKQTQNERVFLFMREDKKIGNRRFFCHARIMNLSGTVSYLFIAAIAAEQSPEE